LTASIFLQVSVASASSDPLSRAVHQLVLAEHHREFFAPSHQAKLDVGTRHARRIDLQPRNHAKPLCRW